MNVMSLLPSAMLTVSDSFIVGPIAKVFAVVLDTIFNFISNNITEINALAISIVIFTVLIKLLLLPLMVNQQKSMRRMQLVQPKLQKIQNKYKGQKDPESQRKMQAEMQKLYSKHKVNPFGGCLPMLIQFPILFAMYAVFRAMPGYITQLNEVYTGVANTLMATDGWQQTLFDVVTNSKLAIQGLPKEASAYTLNNVIDILYLADTTAITGAFQSLSEAAVESLKHGKSITDFLGIFNLSKAPGWGFPGLIIPVIAGGTTFVQSKLMMAKMKKKDNKKDNGEPNTMEQSQKMMNTIFPFMMAFISVTAPLGLSLYWITSNLFQIGQQAVINNIMDKEEEKRRALIREKRAKMEAEGKLTKKRPRPKKDS